MKLISNLTTRWKSIIDTISRFPLAIVLLIVASIMNVILISVSNDFTGGVSSNEIYAKLVITFLLGALVSVVGQLTYERFFKKKLIRYVYMAGAILSSLVYYIAVKDTGFDGIKVGIRTFVIFFVLTVLFIWIPVINNRYHFNQSFLAVFKGFFTSIFFTGVLYLGIVLVLAATDLLIAKLSFQVYQYFATIIFMVLSPTYFLSIIPDYQKEETEEERINKLISSSKFIDALISYIIIPVTIVFTAILIIYIVLNISGKFWTRNLMEPLLVSYTLTVIVVYLLSCNLQNQISKLFRKVFPKVLIPIVLFQTIASVLKINELGVTYGRYYVILFGIFALIAGILFSILPLRKNGVIAPILVVLALSSIIPPIDSFTVSSGVQASRLKNTLVKNDMLQNEKINAKANISQEDKDIISSTISYLDEIEETNGISWLSTYAKSNNFRVTFGFDQYGAPNNSYVNINRDESTPISVNGYDYLVRANYNTGQSNTVIVEFDHDKKAYSINAVMLDGKPVIQLKQNSQNLVSIEVSQIFDKFQNESEKQKVHTEELTFKGENNVAAIALIANSININDFGADKEQYGDFYILVDLK